MRRDTRFFSSAQTLHISKLIYLNLSLFQKASFQHELAHVSFAIHFMVTIDQPNTLNFRTHFKGNR